MSVLQSESCKMAFHSWMSPIFRRSVGGSCEVSQDFAMEDLRHPDSHSGRICLGFV